MRELHAFQPPWPSAFVEGLLLEGLVNEQGQFRSKSTFLLAAIALVTDHPDAAAVLKHAAQEVHGSHPKTNPFLAGEDYELARGAIEPALAQGAHQAATR